MIFHSFEFSFSRVTLCDTLRVLKPVLCFHMTPSNYGAKRVRDADPACRCHQSNSMPDSIFSVNIAQCGTCLFAFCFVLFYVYIKGWYSGLLLFVETGCSVLSYNGLKQIGLISFKWGSLFGALSVDSKQRISFGGSSVVYGVLLLSQEYCSFSQYNLQDRMLQLLLK